MPYQQRMFYDKPFTKCFDCIMGDKIRCKQCMKVLIQKVLLSKEQSLKENFRNVERKPVYRVVKKSKSSLYVTTSFDIWMKNAKQKRVHDADIIEATFQKWPRKPKVCENQMIEVVRPRFQRWHQKLIDHMSTSKSVQKLTKNIVY